MRYLLRLTLLLPVMGGGARKNARPRLLFEISLLLAAAMVTGCTGDEEVDEPAPDPPALSDAGSYSSFVNEVMPFYFNAATVERFRQYDHDFPDYPETMQLIDPNGRRPIGPVQFGEIEEWGISVAPGQGFTPQHPDMSATMRLVGTGNPRTSNYSSIDLVTGLTGEGEAKLYWGIKNINPAQSPHLPISMVFEQIVKHEGVPQYRAIGIIEGVLLTPLTPGVSPSVGIRAGYALYAVEAFNGGLTGQLLNHRICLAKAGFIGAGYQPSGNWCN